MQHKEAGIPYLASLNEPFYIVNLDCGVNFLRPFTIYLIHSHLMLIVMMMRGEALECKM